MSREKKGLRETIRSRLADSGSTPYELAGEAQECGICHRSTIYRYLSGESSISSDVLEWILGELGLAVTARPTQKKVVKKSGAIESNRPKTPETAHPDLVGSG